MGCCITYVHMTEPCMGYCVIYCMYMYVCVTEPYLGCWKDTGKRALDGSFTGLGPANTVQNCRQRCKELSEYYFTQVLLRHFGNGDKFSISHNARCVFNYFQVNINPQHPQFHPLFPEREKLKTAQVHVCPDWKLNSGHPGQERMSRCSLLMKESHFNCPIKNAPQNSSNQFKMVHRFSLSIAELNCIWSSLAQHYVPAPDVAALDKPALYVPSSYAFLKYHIQPPTPYYEEHLTWT